MRSTTYRRYLGHGFLFMSSTERFQVFFSQKLQEYFQLQFVIVLVLILVLPPLNSVLFRHVHMGAEGFFNDGNQ